METILPKICGPKNNIKSKATEWGDVSVARQKYIRLKDHKKLSVIETRLFVICENPHFGASSDAIDSQKLSVHGHTETNQ